MAETLSGVIENVIFHNPENGFGVLRVGAVGRRDDVTVVGNLPSAVAGEYIEAKGEWKQDRDHGMQFKAVEIRTTPPHTVEGIEKYLGSGLIKGIGPHYARKIVEAFGERTLAVIDENPAFLQEVRGIGSRRLQLIRQSWQEQKAVRSIMVFLQSHGVGTARAVRIYKTYGDQAIDIVRANPYRLATDIWGIGFKSADQIAIKIGIDRHSPLRARAAVRYVLQELSNDGHCGFPESGVTLRTSELTGIGRDVIAAVIAEGIKEGEFVRDAPEKPTGGTPWAFWLYIKGLFQAEVVVAGALRSLRHGRHPLPAIKTEAALAWVEKKMNMQLADSQRQAIRQAATQKVLVITGGPGVGKTTLVRAILEIFSAKGLHCELCAPTGRAAKRLTETTGREGRTIHRLLEFDPSVGTFKRDLRNPLDLDLLVVDETSMVDVVLMSQLLQALPSRTCLVLVGDVDQLPSVGPGTVLGDIIASGVVPVVRLTEIFRQAGQSWIVRAAHRVKNGEMPESAPNAKGDYYLIEADSPDVILERIITLVRERIPSRFGFDPFRDIQVLTPMNRTELGARNLNAQLQEVLNPPNIHQPKPGPQRAGLGKTEIQRFGWTFRVGDKVLQTVNNYQKEIFNGDIGRVTAIDMVRQEVQVNFDGRQLVYDFGELDELALAYALTIHKSQGSEYPAVVIPLHTQHYLMLQRNLLYTGITRGKKLVALVGSRRALALAVQRQDTNRRYTSLCRRLQE
jgi:exodeoxyribonuclease V alpha subunit